MGCQARASSKAAADDVTSWEEMRHGRPKAHASDAYPFRIVTTTRHICSTLLLFFNDLSLNADLRGCSSSGRLGRLLLRLPSMSALLADSVVEQWLQPLQLFNEGNQAMLRL